MNARILQFLAEHAPPGGHWPEFSVDVRERSVYAYNREPYDVWNFLQSALPADCRCLLHGRCALVTPHGTILAVVIGMHYVLRVPPDRATTILQSPKMQWYIDRLRNAGGPPPHEFLGEGWIWGMSQPEEPAWCRAVYDSVETPQPTESSSG